MDTQGEEDLIHLAKGPSIPPEVTERFRIHPIRTSASEWIDRTVDQLRDFFRRSIESIQPDHWIERRQRFRELSREFVETAREQFLNHPTVVKVRLESERLAAIFYRRCLPVINEIARNSFLVGASAFLVGLLVSRILIPGSRYRCPMKPQNMKAIVGDANRLDGLESLLLSSDYERPRIEHPDQVLVRIHSASVDPSDISLLSGVGRNERRPDPRGTFILGRDFSGVVVEVGLQVNNLNVGDGVWSALPLVNNGSLCEYIVLRSSQVKLKPPHLGHDSACTIPYAGLQTWKALVDEAGIEPGDASLIVALVVDGTSSTGCIAIQLLSAWGAQVVTCVPYRVAPLAHMLGADQIIPITPADVDAEEKCRHALYNSPKFDLIIQTRDDGLLSDDFCKLYLKPTGKIVRTFVTRLDSDSFGFFRNFVLSISRTFYDPYNSLDVSHLDYLKDLVDQGQLQPVLDSSCPPESFEEAFQMTAAQATVGKVVVNFVSKRA